MRSGPRPPPLPVRTCRATDGPNGTRRSHIGIGDSAGLRPGRPRAPAIACACPARRGYTEFDKVQAIVLIQTAGGECIEDMRVLARDGGLIRLLHRPLPSPDALHDFLGTFHDEPQMAQRARRGDSRASELAPTAAGPSARRRAFQTGGWLWSPRLLRRMSGPFTALVFRDYELPLADQPADCADLCPRYESARKPQPPARRLRPRRLRRNAAPDGHRLFRRSPRRLGSRQPVASDPRLLNAPHPCRVRSHPLP